MTAALIFPFLLPAGLPTIIRLAQRRQAHDSIEGCRNVHTRLFPETDLPKGPGKVPGAAGRKPDLLRQKNRGGACAPPRIDVPLIS